MKIATRNYLSVTLLLALIVGLPFAVHYFGLFGLGWNEAHTVMGSGMAFGFHGFGMLLFWGALIFLLFSIGRDQPEERENYPEPSALEILDQRFARDELSREEYQAKKEVLS
jgi:putative membrane protein